MRPLIVEFWRSRLYPRDLVYMRTMRMAGDGSIWAVIPDPYAPDQLARILAGMHTRYGAPKRQVRQGQGRIVRLLFDAQTRTPGGCWRNYTKRREEQNALQSLP